MRGDPSNPADWFRYAQRDLERAACLDANTDPEGVLFHLQQAAEKALKGRLVQLGWKLQRTHDLGALLQALNEMGHGAEWFREDGELLTNEYIADRYPGASDPVPTLEEVVRLKQATARLLRELGTGG